MATNAYLMNRRNLLYVDPSNTQQYVVQYVDHTLNSIETCFPFPNCDIRILITFPVRVYYQHATWKRN